VTETPNPFSPEQQETRLRELFAPLADCAPLPMPAGLDDALREQGIELDAGDAEALGRYLACLRHVNAKINLTAVTNPDEMWQRHVLDSLTLLPFIAQVEAQQVCDVGSGGGLPGIPLAIALRDVQFALMEATAKKARFLESVCEALGLANVQVLADRAETLGAAGSVQRDRFDVITARAVAPLPVLVELCAPLVRVGGFILAVKGQQAAQEVKNAERALRLLHCQVLEVLDAPLGQVILIEKHAPTPNRYPRRPGEPKRAPL
jgi:16S rRNA (guanine527-N7)-methyltransferase